MKRIKALFVKPVILKFGPAEVDQQANFHARGFEIIDHLGLMFWRQTYHRFDFHNDLPSTKKSA